jgi:hypothetical protein
MQIRNTNYHNTSHKSLHHNLQQIEQILMHNNLSIVRADKGKAIALNYTNLLQHKINRFMQENNIAQLRKNPTELYQKKNPTSGLEKKHGNKQKPAKTGHTNETQCTAPQCLDQNPQTGHSH